jgi:lipoate-protein ligase A
MSETWQLLEDPAGDAAWNMAVDEALLQTAGKRGVSLLRVYAWDKPSVSIGYFQKYPAQLAATHVIVRRPTGGGLVYHGEDTTITVVAPPGHALYRMSTGDAYCTVHKAIIAALELSGCGSALRGAMEVPVAPGKALPHGPELTGRRYECFQKPVAGDVVADGRKLAGGAQRRTKAGMLHQGSIAAGLSPEQVADGFRQALGATFQSCELGDEERALAARLVREKYGTENWNKRFV